VAPGYRGTQRCIQDYLSIIARILFFLITDRDCVALPDVDISTWTPSMDVVFVACPPGHNNNDARGRAIYIRDVADPDGVTTHVCSFLSSKLMARVSVIRHHLQDIAPPQMLQLG
jgi:hypothetical protein